MSNNFDDILNILGNDFFEEHCTAAPANEGISPLSEAEQENALDKDLSIEHNRTHSTLDNEYNLKGPKITVNTNDKVTNIASKRITDSPSDVKDDYNLQDFNDTRGGFDLVNNKADAYSNKELDYDALLGDNFSKRVDKPTVKADDYNFDGFQVSTDLYGTATNTSSNKITDSPLDAKDDYNLQDFNDINGGFDINNIADGQNGFPMSGVGESLPAKERSEYDDFFNDFYEVIK